MTVIALPEPVFNPAARVEVRRLGKESHPLIVVDDVLVNPYDMLAFATEQASYAPAPAGSYYPGGNGKLPPAYGHRLTTTLRPALERIFGLPAGRSFTHEGFFGVATTRPEALQPLQAIPHFDSLNPMRIATVHYFCAAPYKGTAFFRHETTGFEMIDARRVETYRAAVTGELEELGRSPLAHVSQATPHYEQIDDVEAVFNRLVVYRSTSLHAGMLGGMDLPADPRHGRLTANSFIDVHRG